MALDPPQQFLPPGLPFLPAAEQSDDTDTSASRSSRSPRSPRSPRTPRTLETPKKTLQSLSPRSKSIALIERESGKSKKGALKAAAAPSSPPPVLLDSMSHDSDLQLSHRKDRKKGSKGFLKRLSVSLNPKHGSSPPSCSLSSSNLDTTPSFPGVRFHDGTASDELVSEGSFPGIRLHTTSSLPSTTGPSSLSLSFSSSPSPSSPGGTPPRLSPRGTGSTGSTIIRSSTTGEDGLTLRSSFNASSRKRRADRASRVVSMIFLKKALTDHLSPEEAKAVSLKKSMSSKLRKARPTSMFHELDPTENSFPMLSASPITIVPFRKDVRVVLVPDEILGHDEAFIHRQLADPAHLPAFVLDSGRSYIQIYTDICNVLQIDSSFFSCEELYQAMNPGTARKHYTPADASSSAPTPSVSSSSSSSSNVQSLTISPSSLEDEVEDDTSSSQEVFPEESSHPSIASDLSNSIDSSFTSSTASSSSSSSAAASSSSSSSSSFSSSSSPITPSSPSPPRLALPSSAPASPLPISPPRQPDIQQHYELTLHSNNRVLSPEAWLNLDTCIFSNPSEDLIVVRRSWISIASNYLRFLDVVDPANPSQVMEQSELSPSFLSLKSRMLLLSNLPALLTRSQTFSSIFFHMGGLTALLDCLLRDPHGVSPSFHMLVLSAMKASMSSSFQNFLRFVTSNENQLMYRLLSAASFASTPSLSIEAIEILVGICQHQSTFKPAVKAVCRVARESRKKPWENLLAHLEPKNAPGLVSISLQLLVQLMLISPNKKQAKLLVETWNSAGLEPMLANLAKVVGETTDKELPVYFQMFMRTMHMYRPPPAVHAVKTKEAGRGKKKAAASVAETPAPDMTDSFSTAPTVTIDELNGQYEVLSYIAKGAFGRVYKVRDRRTNAIWALKEQTKSDIYEHQMVDHCALELEILQVTNGLCPFLVQFHAALQTSTRLFIFMEYVPGGSLWDLLRLRQGPFSEIEARFYASEILLGIECLHYHNFVYRDLKLENLLLDLDGHVKISDFGLSHRQVGDNRIHSFSGTVHYLAPEVLLDSKGEIGHTRAVDWWAFGIILHILLTLDAPFWSDSYALLFEQIKNHQISFTEPLYHNLSPESISLLAGLLTKDPEKRLGSEGATQIKDHRFFDPTAEIAPPMRPAAIEELPVAPGLHPFMTTTTKTSRD